MGPTAWITCFLDPVKNQKGHLCQVVCNSRRKVVTLRDLGKAGDAAAQCYTYRSGESER